LNVLCPQRQLLISKNYHIIDKQYQTVVGCNDVSDRSYHLHPVIVRIGKLIHMLMAQRLQSKAAFTTNRRQRILAQVSGGIRAMNRPPKLSVKLFWMSLSAEGLAAIVAAVLIISMLVFAGRFSF
jgi:hypothetical protein